MVITYTIRTDVKGKRTLTTDAVFTTGDVQAYRLHFVFYDNGVYDATGCSLMVKGKRSDGVVVVDEGVIDNLGNAYYDVKSSMYAVAGELSMEVALLTEEGSYITVKEVIISVREGFGEGELAEDTVPLLTELHKTLVEAKEVTEQARPIVDIVAVEENRVLAEAERVTAEAKRQAGYEEMHNTFSNALVGEESGSSLHLDDVSPIEHNHTVSVKSKNLAKPYETTVLSNDGVLTLEIKDNTWTINSSSESSVGQGFYSVRKFTALKPGTYTVSYQYVSGTCENAYIYFSIYQSAGIILQQSILLDSETATQGYTFTFTLKEETEVALTYDEITGTFDNFIYHIQIEEGTNKTPYTPYIESLEDVTLIQNGKNLSKNVARQSTNTGSLTGRLENNVLTLNGSSSSNIGLTTTSDENLCFFLQPGTYTISLQYVGGVCNSVGGGGSFYVGLHKIGTANKTVFTGFYKGSINRSKTFTITEPNWFYVYFMGYGDFSNLQYHIQVEAGSAMTPYEEYKETKYPVNADGTVDDVALYRPYTSLIPDTAGAIVSCEYNKDANKVIEKLTNAIISLGGNV